MSTDIQPGAEPGAKPDAECADSAPAMSFKDKRLAGTATAADWRRELSKRIRDRRLISHANDSDRSYRSRAQKCRKGLDSYHRNFGVAKGLF